jgi:cytidyltransferase-like protein
MREVALFVGTFDPFHLGHVWQIERTYKFRKFDKLIVAVAKKSPNKPNAINYTHRLELSKLHLKDLDFPFELEIVAIETNEPVEVSKYIRNNLANAKVFRTLGSDSTIHDFRDNLDYLEDYLSLDYVIGVRDLWNLDKLQKSINSLSPDNRAKFSYKIMPIEKRNNLTATNIRNNLAKSYENGLINEAQFRYIKAKKLYK